MSKKNFLPGHSLRFTCKEIIEKKRDFELYKQLLSPRGYIAFHDIDSNHVFKDIYSDDEPKTGKVRRFWEELDYGSKVEIICQKSNGKGYVPYNHLIKEHFGGIGIWKP